MGYIRQEFYFVDNFFQKWGCNTPYTPLMVTLLLISASNFNIFSVFRRLDIQMTLDNQKCRKDCFKSTKAVSTTNFYIILFISPPVQILAEIADPNFDVFPKKEPENVLTEFVGVQKEGSLSAIAVQVYIDMRNLQEIPSFGTFSVSIS